MVGDVYALSAPFVISIFHSVIRVTKVQQSVTCMVLNQEQQRRDSAENKSSFVHQSGKLWHHQHILLRSG